MSFELDHVFQVMESSLNGSLARHNSIAHNVSNINTPGFKRLLVDFEEQLKNTQRLPLKITSPKHISTDTAKLTIEKDNSPGLRADGNNVNLELEDRKSVV